MATEGITGGECPTPSPAPPGFDPAIADQVTLLTLTSALNQQQLNAAAARVQMASSANVMTLGVQLQQAAAIGHIFSSSPADAASAAQVMQAGDVAKLASLQTAARAPAGS